MKLPSFGTNKNIYMLSNLLFLGIPFASADDSFIQLPISRMAKPVSPVRAMNPKPFETGSSLDLDSYFVDFRLSDQQQYTHLDLNAPEVWVYSDKANATQPFNTQHSSKLLGQFDVAHTSPAVKAQYYRDWFALISWDAELDFGLVDQFVPNEPYGVVGLGSKRLVQPREDRSMPEVDAKRISLLEVMKESSQIKSASYSLDLRAGDDSQALIGAFDKSRFTGKMKMWNFTSSYGVSLPFYVDGNVHEAVLDTTSVFSYLDAAPLESLASKFGAQWDSKMLAYRAPGSNRPEGDLTFNFLGVEIKVPAEELWSHYSAEDPSAWYFMILPNTQTYNGRSVLGTSFLRSAYVVVDNDREQVAIGQAASNPGQPQHEVIGADGIKGDFLDLSYYGEYFQ